MNMIYKYELAIKNHLDLPIGAQILTTQLRDDQPVLWVLFDQSVTEMETRRFEWIATGRSFDFGSRTFTYIGTCQNRAGLVYHLFEVIP